MQPGSCRVAAVSSLIVAAASSSFPSAARILTTSTNAIPLLPLRFLSRAAARAAPSRPSQPREPVDRDRVPLGHVRIEQAVAPLVLEPREPLGPLAFVRHQRHAVAARVGDAIHVD